MCDVAAFLEHLLCEVPDRIVIIWDGAPIHRSQLIKDFLANGAAQLAEYVGRYDIEVDVPDGWTQQPPVRQMAGAGPCGDGHPRVPTFEAETVRSLTAIAEAGRLAAENPGVVVGIWVPGQGCDVRGFGTGNLATKAPVSVGDRFRIASLTKTFTATAILQPIDQGQLTLDARLSQFVEGITYGDRITVEELLHMTAGVYSDTDDQTFLHNYEQNPLLPFTPQDAIHMIQ